MMLNTCQCFSGVVIGHNLGKFLIPCVKPHIDPKKNETLGDL